MISRITRFAGESNKDFSYRAIKHAIMNLELKPGQSISEVELAHNLQISRTPIREIMAKLKEENLVVVTPQVGTYVTKINLQLIEEAAFMRFTLEKQILALSCEAFPLEKLEELKHNLALQELLINKEGAEKKFHELDTQFHQLIFETNNKMNVWNAITRLSTHYNRIRFLSEMEKNFVNAIRQHKEWIQVIENKEVDQVETVVREHILEPMKHWKELYQDGAPYVDYFDFSNEKQIIL